MRDERTRPVRHSHPLADVSTPYYLRRFSYEHHGETHVFDEAENGINIEATSAKRASALGLAGPAPKRREREDEPAEDRDDDAMSEVQETPPETRPEDADLETDLDTPTAAPGAAATNTASLGTNLGAGLNAAGVPATARNLSLDGFQPALLSPTASPLGSPSEDERSGISPILTPGTAGPPSASVLTPLPVAEDGRAGEAGGRAFAAPRPYLPRLLAPRMTHLPSVTLHDAAVRGHLNALATAFKDTPPALHRYALFNMLRFCDRSTMSALYSEMEAALQFDVVGSLPPELSSLVLRQLDCQSVFSAARVCRNWYRLLDSDDSVWRQLAAREGLHMTREDVEMARNDRWGYTGWSSYRNLPTKIPTNLFGKPANIYKAVFRRLMLVHQNWMDPTVEPRRYMIRCPDREVITCLDFSDDIIIASTEARRHLNVYDTNTGLLLHEFSDHDGGVWALKRVGRNTVITGSTDHTVRVWSLSKGRCTHVFRGHNATVRCLDVVMPGPAMPSMSGSTASIPPNFYASWAYHSYNNTAPKHAPASSPRLAATVGESSYNFPLILTGSRDTTMRLWRLPRDDERDYDSKVAFVDRENPYFVAELRGHQESVRAVAGCGNIAVSGSYDYRVRVWDLAAKKCRHELVGHENKVYAVVIDAERNRCISSGMDTQIIIWDLATGAPLYKLRGHTGLVGLVSLRDETLVTAAADKTLRVWDPSDGQLLHTLEGHNTAILCFVHDGRRIVSGSERHLKLWDTRTGEFRRDLLTGMDLIWQVSIDRRRCCAAVMRDRCSYLEILDFDFDRTEGVPNSPVEEWSD